MRGEHECSATVGSGGPVVLRRGGTRPEGAAGFVCFAAGCSPGRAEFGVGGRRRGSVERFFRRSLRCLPGPRKESHNKALDRTAMSAGLGVLAEAWLAAALMAVGRLDRSTEKNRDD